MQSCTLTCAKEISISVKANFYRTIIPILLFPSLVQHFWFHVQYLYPVLEYNDLEYFISGGTDVKQRFLIYDSTLFLLK